MTSESGFPVRYYLDGFNVNFLLGKKVTLKYEGNDCCLHCNSHEDIFRQGLCKNCFFEQPQTGDWVMQPELSKAHLGIEDKDLEFEKKIQLQPHIVYLSYAGNFKIGVTRKNQIPTRFIDQGLQQVIVLLEVPNRYLAGVAKLAVERSFSDKTNWRNMLTGYESVDWNQSYNLFIDAIKSNPEIFDLLKSYIIKRKASISQEIIIDFPYNSNKMNLNLKPILIKKIRSFTGFLTGVKGQYLIFENEYVLNIRAHEGCIVNFNFY